MWASRAGSPRGRLRNLAIALVAGWVVSAIAALLGSESRTGLRSAILRAVGQPTLFSAYATVHDLAAKGFDRSKEIALRSPTHHLAVLMMAPLPSWYGAALMGMAALVVVSILLLRGSSGCRPPGFRGNLAWMCLVLGSFPIIVSVWAGDTHLLGLSAALLFVYFYYLAPSSLSYGFLVLAIALEPVTAILIAVPLLDGRRRAAAAIAAGSVAILGASTLAVAFLTRRAAQPVISSAHLLLGRTASEFGYRAAGLTGAHSLWTPFSALASLVLPGRRTILVEGAYVALVVALVVAAFWVLHRVRAGRRTVLMVSLALVSLVPFDSTYASGLAVAAMIALFLSRSKPWRFERAYTVLFAMLLMPADPIRLPLWTIALGVGRQASAFGMGAVVRPLALLCIVLLLLVEARSTADDDAVDAPVQPPVLPLRPYSDSARLISPRALGLLVVLVVTATSQLVIYNRYLPLQEGWFTVFARAIIAGKVPYRDFYLFIPPVYAYVTVVLVRLFGIAFIVFRTWGVIERLLLAGMLYLVLERPFKARSAVVATILGVAVFASNNSDVIHGYTQFTLTLVLAATYLVLLAIDAKGRAGYGLLVLAGVLGGLAFLTKQSLGLFSTVALMFALGVIFFRGDPRRSLASSGAFGIGAAAPIALVVAWLHSQGALRAALGEVFGGASSKGSISSVLFGFIGRTLTLNDALILAAIGMSVVLWWLTGRRAVLPRRVEIEESHGTRLQILCIGAAASLGAIMPRLMPTEFTGVTIFLESSDLTWQAAHWAFYYSVVSVVVLLGYLLLRERSSLARQLFVLSMVSFMATYAYGLSFSLDLASTVPAMSVAIASALVLLVRPIERYGARLLVPLLLVFMVVVSAVATERYSKPYTWWGWSEPPLGALSQSFGRGPTRGMQLSANTVSTFERITDEIDDLTPKESTMFVYPNVSVFYTLADRRPVTFGYVHYYDVMPDKIAVADAHRLLNNPPDSMVMVWLSEEAKKTNLEAFRGGRRSGQDVIEDTVKHLLATGEYVAVDRSVSADRLGGASMLTVYVKRQYAPKPGLLDRPH